MAQPMPASIIAASMPPTLARRAPRTRIRTPMPRVALAVLLIAAAIGCHRGTPKPLPPAPLPGAPPADTRLLSLDDGFITVRVDIPREPPGPKPAVLALLGERPRMLRAGIVTIDYHVHWELLAPLAKSLPSRPLPNARGANGCWRRRRRAQSARILRADQRRRDGHHPEGAGRGCRPSRRST
jgi:hypothetical protein